MNFSSPEGWSPENSAPIDASLEHGNYVQAVDPAEMHHPEIVLLLHTLSENADRNSIPQQEVDQIVSSVLEAYEQGGLDLFDVNKLIGDIGELAPGQQSFNDKMFRAFLTYCKEHEFVFGFREVADQIAQNGQMISPELYVGGWADMYWRPDVNPVLKEEAITGLQYLVSFYPDYYREALLKNLDFKDQKNYFKTGMFLDLLSNLYNAGRDSAYSEDRLPSEINEVLATVLEDKKGSYLLNARAEQLYEQTSEGARAWPKTDRVPFEITKDIYALHLSDGMYVSNEEDVEEIRRLIEEHEVVEEKVMPSQDLIDDALANGEDEVLYEPNQADIRHIRQLERDLIDLLPHKLEPEDLALSRPDKSAKELENDKQHYFDYQFLTSRPMREKIQDDFEINLSELTLKEQMAFLKEIKFGEKDYIQYVQGFGEKFGLEGMRTFLTAEYDPQMAERIFTFAALLDEEEVKMMFSRFSQTLQSTDAFKKGLNQSDLEEGQLFGDQVAESMVRRSFQLFFAAEKIATYQPEMTSGERAVTTEDLNHAFEGVALATSIIGDLHNHQKFEYTYEDAKSKGNNYSFQVTEKDSNRNFSFKVFIRPVSEKIRRSKKSEDGSDEEILQARINIEIGLDALPEDDALRQAFMSEIHHFKDDKKVTGSSIRFAFDLDTAYDPPRLSFDMGRNERHGKTFERTGDVLGNILDKVGPQGHHLTDSFSKDFSKPENFANLASHFKSYFDQAAVAAE